jgi:hypothetical protein
MAKNANAYQKSMEMHGKEARKLELIKLLVSHGYVATQARHGVVVQVLGKTPSGATYTELHVVNSIRDARILLGLEVNKE